MVNSAAVSASLLAAELARAEAVAAADVAVARNRAQPLKLSFPVDSQTMPAFQPSCREPADG
ncbi:hypothetical protein V6B08_07460 [Ferrovibrio sp. MS7]|jgi:hypothetical protein|uniref:hypothetical protein n=1 Tax=Ferrovibrio plantarum TaxID=3119164 RepID=UPI0031354B14